MANVIPLSSRRRTQSTGDRNHASLSPLSADLILVARVALTAYSCEASADAGSHTTALANVLMGYARAGTRFAGRAIPPPVPNLPTDVRSRNLREGRRHSGLSEDDLERAYLRLRGGPLAHRILAQLDDFWDP